jgi:hypothetical protein
MAILPCVMSALLSLAVPLSAQFSKARLMRLFASDHASPSTFTVKPGVEIKAIYGPHEQACVLTVTGPVSEQELLKVFDTVAPPKSRGVKKSDMIECVGACQRNISYDWVTFTTGVVGQHKRQNQQP